MGDHWWVFFVRHVEIRRCAHLMQIRSYCCLTVDSFAVIFCVLNLRDERQAPPALVTHRIKELLLWMTLTANEYEYIYKNRHGHPSQCILGVTVTLAEHGWWEGETAAPEMEGSDKHPPPTHMQTNKCHRMMTFKNAPAFKNDDLVVSRSYLLTGLQQSEIPKRASTSLYVPEIIVIHHN